MKKIIVLILLLTSCSTQDHLINNDNTSNQWWVTFTNKKHIDYDYEVNRPPKNKEVSQRSYVINKDSTKLSYYCYKYVWMGGSIIQEKLFSTNYTLNNTVNENTSSMLIEKLYYKSDDEYITITVTLDKISHIATIKTPHGSQII